MRILITNDDGIHAPGLAALERIAAQITDEVWIVAPETDQSGASHSLTLNDPLRLRPISERHFAVRGTPTDCVIMGLRHIMEAHPPDLILSGVNRGQNIADDVTYSGTIAAAMEGTLLGTPSIALSQAYGFSEGRRVRWNTAEALGADIVRRLWDAKIPPNTVINVNFPDRDPEDVEGISLTRQGKRDQSLMTVEKRTDGRGNPYYWLGFERSRSRPAVGTDLWAVYEGWISITPLALDLTDQDTTDALRSAFPE